MKATAPFERTRPPVVGPARSMHFPELEELTLSGGLRVVLVRKEGLPIVTLRLLVRGGAGVVPPRAAGLAGLTADMLDEGTSSRSALGLAEAVERLGARLEPTDGWDANAVSLSVLEPRLPEALELFAEVVLDPIFADRELERVRHERITRVVQSRDEPRVLASDALARVLYGAGHPYGTARLGTEDTLEKIQRNDVEAFYRAHYHPGNATLVVVGDVGVSTLEGLLEAALGSWKPRRAPGATWPKPSPPGEGRIFVVDKPGAAQSEIRVGGIGASRGTPDYFPLTVLNTILGGSFTSRLNAKLREERGYTYGARSEFDMRVTPGPFTAQTAVHTPVTDSAVADSLCEIQRLATEPVPLDELERARNYVALRLPQRFETVDDLAARVAELVLYDLRADFWDRYVERILAVGAEDVQTAARVYLDVGSLRIVVAGDRSAVEEPLRRLGIGEVVALPSQLDQD